MNVATAVRVLRPDTLLETVRNRSAVEALAVARPSGQVVAVCGLHGRAGSTAVTAHLAELLGRLHPGRVVALDTDLDRGGLAQCAHARARIRLDDLDAFLRTPSSVEPSWSVPAPVVDDAGAHPAGRVAELLRWSRPRLDTVLVDVPSRWRRAVLDALLPSIDVIVATTRAGQRFDEEIGLARHWLNGRQRPDLAEHLVIVECEPDGGDEHRSRRRRRGGRRFRLGATDAADGWPDLSPRDRDELVRLAAALRGSRLRSSGRRGSGG